MVSSRFFAWSDGKNSMGTSKKRPKKNIPDGWMLVGKIIELRGFSIFQP
jgi:hypothetical protein